MEGINIKANNDVSFSMITLFSDKEKNKLIFLFLQLINSNETPLIPPISFVSAKGLNPLF